MGNHRRSARVCIVYSHLDFFICMCVRWTSRGRFIYLWDVRFHTVAAGHWVMAGEEERDADMLYGKNKEYRGRNRERKAESQLSLWV